MTILLLPLESASLASAAESGGPGGRFFMYVGTYTGNRSRGIHAFEMDTASNSFSKMEWQVPTVNPTFLAIHPNRQYLYAVNEIGKFQGTNAGAVSAFRINKETGWLHPLNQVSAGGPGPCHIVVDPSGKAVVVANYSGGSVAVLPVQADGKLGEASAFVQHEGSSINRQRQEAPHAHGIAIDPANRFALVADLGLDKVLVYALDAAKGTLTPRQPGFAPVKPGAGPRHVTFHPNGRYVYVINELDSTVTAFSYEATEGALKEIQTISTLPDSFEGKSTTAEIEVHPSGKFLYGSNRGHDSIVVYAISPEHGTLTLVEHQTTGGKTPRNFAIDPTGRLLLAANQDSDEILVFRIEAQDGTLIPTTEILKVGAPVCIKFVER